MMDLCIQLHCIRFKNEERGRIHPKKPKQLTLSNYLHTFPRNHHNQHDQAHCAGLRHSCEVVVRSIARVLGTAGDGHRMLDIEDGVLRFQWIESHERVRQWIDSGSSHMIESHETHVLYHTGWSSLRAIRGLRCSPD